MYKILVSDKLGEAGLERLAKAQDIDFKVTLNLSHDELVDAIGGVDAIIVRSGTRVDADVLAAGRNLKVIGRAGIGVDNIDVKAATSRGVIIMNTPQANAVATAEHAMAMMLAAARHIAPAHASVKAGEWRRSDFVGQQLYRNVLGIIGFGRIGRLVATRAQAFGMEILAYDPYVSEDVARELGVTLVELDDLLSEANYISLHTVTSPETRHMINQETFSQMKDGVIIVNCARGQLIDETALAAALDSGKVQAAAVDVYEQEPPGEGNPLVGHPLVLHSPHLGASTYEAQRDVATQIVDQVLDALRGTDVRNAVNMPFRAGPDFSDIWPYMELAEKLGVLQAALAPGPIRRVEVEIRGDMAERLIRPTAAAMLKGLLEKSLPDHINYINAPVLAADHGIAVSQTKGMSLVDYPNLISCSVHWDEGQRLLGGVLFGGVQPRLIQVDEYHLDVNPQGILLVLRNQDVPGVIGRVGTILAADTVNIGEWRMGRRQPGGEALSFISLDNTPSVEALAELKDVEAVVGLQLVTL
ncbi:MAG: phosphoglycerate dehydrogenase [Chloroflexota bacterium]|nr:MAG: phosphoglycerate dehydrogenase [Chloroflexota bacterium]